jgi:hypothetical protein
MENRQRIMSDCELSGRLSKDVLPENVNLEKKTKWHEEFRQMAILGRQQ